MNRLSASCSQASRQLTISILPAVFGEAVQKCSQYYYANCHADARGGSRSPELKETESDDEVPNAHGMSPSSRDH
jgi:hypothetical protein